MPNALIVAPKKFANRLGQRRATERPPKEAHLAVDEGAGDLLEGLHRPLVDGPVEVDRYRLPNQPDLDEEGQRVRGGPRGAVAVHPPAFVEQIDFRIN